MIVFDLRCGAGHIFESWFASSAAYEEQRGRKLVCCPICNDDEIGKAVMAPNVAAKGNRGRPPAGGPDKTTLAMLAEAQRAMLEKSQWVGSGFPDRARAMHLGEEAPASIHGETTAAEARELIEEGVPITALPFPVIAPTAQN